MNTLSRTITGTVIAIFSVWLIVFGGFISASGVDYTAILMGIAFLGVGIFIFFNKNEDKIEQIKKK